MFDHEEAEGDYNFDIKLRVKGSDKRKFMEIQFQGGLEAGLLLFVIDGLVTDCVTIQIHGISPLKVSSATPGSGLLVPSGFGRLGLHRSWSVLVKLWIMIICNILYVLSRVFAGSCIS
jgi:hypothetical protein